MPQDLPSNPAEALEQATDTPQTADTARAAAPDTSDAITRVSRELDEATDLLIAGEWELFWTRLYEGSAELLLTFVPLLLKTFLVFLLLFSLYRVFGQLLSRVLHRSRRVDAGLQNLLMKTYRVVALSFILVMVLSQLQVNVAALLAGLSIVGIAVGFAARDTLENFFAGVTILVDKPFRVGDNIDIDGTFGTVDGITLRSTRLRTLNSEIMVMPNIQMINQKLVNHTILGTLRIGVPFGIAYKEYPHQAREVVLKLCEGDTRLDPDFKPKVVVTGLGASSVDMELRFYLRNPKLEVPVRFEYIEKVREALREADIEIPFPHLQLFVDEAKAFENSFLMEPRLPMQNGGHPSA